MLLDAPFKYQRTEQEEVGVLIESARYAVRSNIELHPMAIENRDTYGKGEI